MNRSPTKPLPSSAAGKQVLHVSFSSLGGAGAVAVRLLDAQQRMGWRAGLISMVDRPFPAWAAQAPLLALKALVDHYLVRRNPRCAFFSLLRASHGVRRLTEAAADTPGILHLHWLPGTIHLPALFRRPLQAQKIVWSVQDLWLLTGGCHYTNGCEQFTSGCRACPQVRPCFRHRVARHFCEKAATLQRRRDIQLVVPSTWTRDQVRRSQVTRDLPVCVIPNPVDTKGFTPGSRQACRQRLSLKPDQAVLGLGAADIRDERKQIGATLKVIQTLPAFRDKTVQVIVFGAGAPKPPHPAGVRYLGASSDPLTLRTWYRAMDVYISMSRYETFGNTLAEAAACGTPSICLAGSGMSDVVVPGTTGEVVNSFASLGACLNSLLDHRPRLSALGSHARDHAVKNFATDSVARHFLDLYEQLPGS